MHTNEYMTNITEANIQYHYNMIKGRIAETLIQEMFVSLGYEVYHYGMEHMVPGITGKLNKVHDPVSLMIRNTPDFVVKEPVRGKVMMVEVKFRANGKYAEKDLPKDFAYPDTWFIIVSRRDIKCLKYKELMAGSCIEPSCTNYLASRKEFNLDPERVSRFSEFAVKFFAEV